MLKDRTAFARRIIEFYAEKGLDCSVVDEHRTLLVTLCSGAGTHEFRCARHDFAAAAQPGRLAPLLERELGRLKRAADGGEGR